jgi:hypothetical protein
MPLSGAGALGASSFFWHPETASAITAKVTIIVFFTFIILLSDSF